jgi:diacylglycerol kinase (ATP)
VILNPAARRGRSRAALASARAAFEPLGADFQVTSRAGEEELLARTAAEGGAETIVVVGGDGTWGNVAHGIFSSGAAPRLALLAAGTGNDFVKSVAVPAYDAMATARLVENGAEWRADVGLADDRVFLNCFGVGFDTAVLERLPRIPIFRGKARYVVAALAELFSYRARAVSIEPSFGGENDATLLTVIANGAWYGGAFHIAPGAGPHDGLLDAVRIEDVRGIQRLALLAAAMRGTHTRNAAVKTLRGAEFTLTFSEPPVMNLDGEIRRAGGSRIKVRVLPQWLRLVAALHARGQER